MINVCRDNLPFGEVPIKLYLQKRESQDVSSREKKSSDEILE
ncbi:MAG: hypothetical protein R3C56_16410 [Pirellulaceae bacterium]